jgi:hypothetical protein
MEKSKLNKKMKELKNAGFLNNFTIQQKKCLRELIKNQQDFIILENEQKETEKSLFKAKGLELHLK